jgi:2-polyprenyl-3-methyl-5-hydroxy-6-metoxy-1,4-benzoquinol methylase
VWDELYRDPSFQLHADTEQLIKDIVPILKKKQVKKILSAPCGDFINESYLGKHGFAVDGIDTAPTAIRKSKEKIKSQKLSRCTVRLGDIFEMKLRKRDYDAVIVHDLTMHLSNETCVTLLSKLSAGIQPENRTLTWFGGQYDEN